MSTSQSIYQQPPPAYTKTPQNNVKPSSVPNNVSPGFVKTRQSRTGNIYKSPIININYGKGSYSPGTISQNYPNPAFVGTPRPQPSAPPKTKPSLTEEKLQTLEKIEEMKDAAETKSADEMSNKATKKYAIIGAIILVMIAVGTLLWVFVLSKTRSVKDAFSSSDNLVTSGKSSDKWADSSGKSV